MRLEILFLINFFIKFTNISVIIYKEILIIMLERVNLFLYKYSIIIYKKDYKPFIYKGLFDLKSYYSQRFLLLVG